MRVLVVDNYDSFTYNLVQYLGELGAELDVVRNDVEELLERQPDRVIVSPGPCTPAEAGVSVEAIRRFARGGRAGARASASATRRSRRRSAARSSAASRCTARPPRSSTTAGRSSAASTSPLVAGRYHSLDRRPRRLPEHLEVSARTGDVIMGLRHRELPAEGVQFHPESVLTADGKALLRNFLDA